MQDLYKMQQTLLPHYLSDKSVESYSSGHREWIAYCNRFAQPECIKTGDTERQQVLAFGCWRYFNGASAGAIRRNIQAVQSLMSIMGKELDVLKWTPLKNFLKAVERVRPTPSNAKRPFSREELKAILDWIPPLSIDHRILRAHILLAANAGLRVGQYTADSQLISKAKRKLLLRWGSFYPSSANDGSTGYTVYYKVSKTNKSYTLEHSTAFCRCPEPCFEAEYQALHRAIEKETGHKPHKNNYFGQWSNGNLITGNQIYRFLQNACTALGITNKQIATHSLRKTEIALSM